MARRYFNNRLWATVPDCQGHTRLETVPLGNLREGVVGSWRWLGSTTLPCPAAALGRLPGRVERSERLKANRGAFRIDNHCACVWRDRRGLRLDAVSTPGCIDHHRTVVRYLRETVLRARIGNTTAREGSRLWRNNCNWKHSSTGLRLQATGDDHPARMRTSPNDSMDNYAHVVGATLPIEQG